MKTPDPILPSFSFFFSVLSVASVVVFPSLSLVAAKAAIETHHDVLAANRATERGCVNVTEIFVKVLTIFGVSNTEEGADPTPSTR